MSNHTWKFHHNWLEGDFWSDLCQSTDGPAIHDRLHRSSRDAEGLPLSICVGAANGQFGDTNEFGPSRGRPVEVPMYMSQSRNDPSSLMFLAARLLAYLEWAYADDFGDMSDAEVEAFAAGADRALKRQPLPEYSAVLLHTGVRARRCGRARGAYLVGTPGLVRDRGEPVGRLPGGHTLIRQPHFDIGAGSILDGRQLAITRLAGRHFVAQQAATASSASRATRSLDAGGAGQPVLGGRRQIGVLPVANIYCFQPAG